MYEGIYELLDNLRNRGVKLYVATSKPTEYTLRILDKYELSEYFEYVSGSSMDEKNSDKSIIIKHAIDTCNIPCDKALMIGDRKFDIIGAKANNIASVGVLYGYGNSEELMAEQAMYIVNKPEDIVNIVMG